MNIIGREKLLGKLVEDEYLKLNISLEYGSKTTQMYNIILCFDFGVKLDIILSYN